MNVSELNRRIVKENLSINVEGAVALREAGIEKARAMGISGFLTIVNDTGMEQASQVVGLTANPLTVEIARAKIKTVLAVHRSTSLQRRRMIEMGQSIDLFAGQLGTLFSGGVAAFADEALTQFVGAMAFSGATQEQDEEICRTAIERIGLYTDLPKYPEQPAEQTSTK